MNPKKKLYYPLCQLNLFFKIKIVILLFQYNINMSGYKIKKTEAFFLYIYNAWYGFPLLGRSATYHLG